MENAPIDDGTNLYPLAYHKRASRIGRPISAITPPYFHQIYIYEAGCSQSDFEKSFSRFTGNVESERLLEMSDGALGPWIGGAEFVASYEMARLLHFAANPPQFGLIGLNYGPLDPECPETDDDGEFGIELAVEYLNERGEDIDCDAFDFIPVKSLRPFLPVYAFPWNSAKEVWPSHVAELLIHLYKTTVKQGFKPGYVPTR